MRPCRSACYGLGTNTGLKRQVNADPGTTYQDLRYARSRYIHKEQLRYAIVQVANAIFAARKAEIWGEGTTACASDSKKFGAWNQNLLTEWHIRYRGPGIMVYWHVEKKSTCIYSQVKSCSSSEVAAMIEGILRHCTDAEIQANYVDSHGQFEVAFAFCHLLGFRLLPRLKDIGSQRLYRAEKGNPEEFANLQPVLTRAIDWDLISKASWSIFVCRRSIWSAVRSVFSRGRGERTVCMVPFPHAFRELLGLHIQQMQQKQAGYLFESVRKHKYSDRGVRRMLERYATAAGIIRSLSPHKWRHFLFTWLKGLMMR